MALTQITTLMLILLAWTLFYIIGKRLKLDEKGWEISPYYALYKSTRLNDVIHRIAAISPGFWRILGNVGIVASVGQVSFITYILLKNIWNFIFVPQNASPVQPLIPGVTISVNSLPWFLLAAGVIILTHELGHGLMCVTDGIPIKSSAFLIAVITFGGAVEPDEEGMAKASLLSKMRVFGIGSMINLLTGLIIIPIFIVFGKVIPVYLLIFLNWLYFIAINLAMMNMLPIGPLDGGQMWRTFTENMQGGETLQRFATYGFIVIILTNIGLSLSMFGLVPI
jgi:Zn-dependent protease